MTKIHRYTAASSHSQVELPTLLSSARTNCQQSAYLGKQQNYLQSSAMLQNAWTHLGKVEVKPTGLPTDLPSGFTKKNKIGLRN